MDNLRGFLLALLFLMTVFFLIGYGIGYVTSQPPAQPTNQPTKRRNDMSKVSQTAEDLTLEDRIAELRIRLDRLEDAASTMGTRDEYCSVEDYWSLLQTLCFYDVPTRDFNNGSN